MGGLFRNHVSYGGLRSKLILPDDMGFFLSNSRGTNPSSESSTFLIEEGEVIRRPAYSNTINGGRWLK